MKQEQIEALIQDMTLEEKLGQMTQLAPFFFGTDENVDLTGPMAELRLSDEDLSNIGSTLNCFGARQVIELQKKYMEHNRHHIPLLFMGDVIHGFKTVFRKILHIHGTAAVKSCKTVCRVLQLEQSV